MKTAFTCIFIVFFALCLGGCGPAPSADIFELDQAERIDFKSDPQLAENYLVRQFAADLPSEKYTVGSISSFGSFYYYLQTKDIPMGQYMERCDIVAYDLLTDERKTVYSYDRPGFWLNELKAGENALFWVMEEGGEFRIEKFDLESGEVSTVKVLDQGGGVSLETDGAFLSWYEYDGARADLFVYDMEQGTTKHISDQIATQSPYTRGSVRDGLIAFLTDAGTHQIIHLYDLRADEMMKEIPIAKDFRAAHVQGNRDHVIWSQGDYGEDDFQLYAYDIDAGKISRIGGDREDLVIFSFHLAGHALFINDSANNGILCRHLGEGTETVLLSQPGEEFTFYLSTAIENENYAAIDQKNAALIHIENVHSRQSDV